MKLRLADFMRVAIRHDAAFHQTIDGTWFASNYFADGTVQTSVFQRPEDAARQFCQIQDLMGEVLLTRIGNDDEPYTRPVEETLRRLSGYAGTDRQALGAQQGAPGDGEEAR